MNKKNKNYKRFKGFLPLNNDNKFIIVNDRVISINKKFNLNNTVEVIY